MGRQMVKIKQLVPMCKANSNGAIKGVNTSSVIEKLRTGTPGNYVMPTIGDEELMCDSTLSALNQFEDTESTEVPIDNSCDKFIRLNHLSLVDKTVEMKDFRGLCVIAELMTISKKGHSNIKRKFPQTKCSWNYCIKYYPNNLPANSIINYKVESKEEAIRFSLIFCLGEEDINVRVDELDSFSSRVGNEKSSLNKILYISPTLNGSGNTILDKPCKKGCIVVNGFFNLGIEPAEMMNHRKGIPRDIFEGIVSEDIIQSSHKKLKKKKIPSKSQLDAIRPQSDSSRP
jgi:hypothetical protein